MASAREELEGLVGGLRPADPSRLLLSNADGAAVDTGAEVAARLVSQVTSPVRFDACLATLRELGVTAVIELPPAGALAGLAKREWKGAGIEIARPDQPGRPRPRPRADRRRARPSRGRAPPDWRVVVSPARGTVSPAEVAEGSRLPAGSPARLHPQPSRGSQRLRRLRRGTGRVARPRGRPRRRRRPDRPSLPGGRRSDHRSSCRPAPPGARILGLGAYRPRRRVTNDDLAQIDGHQRRVDPEPGRHRRAPLGRARTRRSSRWPSRPAARRWPPAGWRPTRSTWSSSPAPACARPSRASARRWPHRLGIPPAGRVRPQRRLRRASATRSASPTDAIRAGAVPQRPRRRRRAAHRRHRPDDRTHRGDLRRRRRAPPSSAPSDEPGIGPVAWGSDGDQFNAIEIAAGQLDDDHGRPGGLPLGDHQAHRDPRARRWSRPASAAADIDVFAPHQANLRIVESMAKRLGFGPRHRRSPATSSQSGNTSAASIPLALTALMESGEAQVRRPRRSCSATAPASPSPGRYWSCRDTHRSRDTRPGRRADASARRPIRERGPRVSSTAGDPVRPGRDPGGGRRRDARRRHPREVVHRRPRRRLAVDGRDRHRRRGQVRRRRSPTTSSPTSRPSATRSASSRRTRAEPRVLPPHRRRDPTGRPGQPGHRSGGTSMSTSTADVVVTGLGATTPLGGDVAEHLGGAAGRPVRGQPASPTTGPRTSRPSSSPAWPSTRPSSSTGSRPAGWTAASRSRVVAAEEAWRGRRRRPTPASTRCGSPSSSAPASAARSPCSARTTSWRRRARKRVSPLHHPDAHAQRPGRGRRPGGRRQGRRARPGQRLRVRRRGDPLGPGPAPPRPRRRRRRRRHRGRASTRCRWPASPRCARCRTRNDEPERASRPFDKARDGFVLGEGAGGAGARARRRTRPGPRRARSTPGWPAPAAPPTATTSSRPHPEGEGAARAITRGAARRRADPGRHRARQRARHLDAGRRHGRGGARSARRSASTRWSPPPRRDRPPARRGRRAGVDRSPILALRDADRAGDGQPRRPRRRRRVQALDIVRREPRKATLHRRASTTPSASAATTWPWSSPRRTSRHPPASAPVSRS